MRFGICSLLVLTAALPAPAADRADPAATRLLAEARAARARWTNFEGFAADVAVNVEGKITRGKVLVHAEGKLKLDLPDPAAQGWARRVLASTVAHRLDNSASLDTPCTFADDNADHPLGRAIRVLNDEFHSSYRIRDRQISVVNRQMKERGVRFTITVLENRLNVEKKFLPVSFVVNTWDLKTGALHGSEAHHYTWKRVGKFDLPARTLVVTAGKDKQEGRSLTLSNFKLNEPAARR